MKDFRNSPLFNEMEPPIQNVPQLFELFIDFDGLEELVIASNRSSAVRDIQPQSKNKYSQRDTSRSSRGRAIEINEQVNQHNKKKKAS